MLIHSITGNIYGVLDDVLIVLTIGRLVKRQHSVGALLQITDSIVVGILGVVQGDLVRAHLDGHRIRGATIVGVARDRLLQLFTRIGRTEGDLHGFGLNDITSLHVDMLDRQAQVITGRPLGIQAGVLVSISRDGRHCGAGACSINIPATEDIAFASGLLVNLRCKAPGMGAGFRLISAIVQVVDDAVDIGHQRGLQRRSCCSMQGAPTGHIAVGNGHGPSRRITIIQLGNADLIVVLSAVPFVLPNALFVILRRQAVVSHVHHDAVGSNIVLRDSGPFIVRAGLMIMDLRQHCLGTEALADLGGIHNKGLIVAFGHKVQMAIDEGLNVTIVVHSGVVIQVVARAGRSILVSSIIVLHVENDAVGFVGMQAGELVFTCRANVAGPFDIDHLGCNVLHDITHDLTQNHGYLFSAVTILNADNFVFIIRVGTVHGYRASQDAIPTSIKLNITGQQFVCLGGRSVGLIHVPTEELMLAVHRLIASKRRDVILVRHSLAVLVVNLTTHGVEDHIVGLNGNHSVQGTLLGRTINVRTIQRAETSTVMYIRHGGGVVAIGIGLNDRKAFRRHSDVLSFIHKAGHHHAVAVVLVRVRLDIPHGIAATALASVGINIHADAALGTLHFGNDVPLAVIVEGQLVNHRIRPELLGHTIGHLHRELQVKVGGLEDQLDIDRPVTIAVLGTGHIKQAVVGLLYSHTKLRAAAAVHIGRRGSGVGRSESILQPLIITVGSGIGVRHRTVLFIGDLRGGEVQRIAGPTKGIIGRTLLQQGYFQIGLVVSVVITTIAGLVVNGHVDGDAHSLLPLCSQHKGFRNEHTNRIARLIGLAVVAGPAHKAVALTHGNLVGHRHFRASEVDLLAGIFTLNKAAAAAVVGDGVMVQIEFRTMSIDHQRNIVSQMVFVVLKVIDMIGAVIHTGSMDANAGVLQTDVLIGTLCLHIESSNAAMDLVQVREDVIQVGIDCCGVHRLGGILHVGKGILDRAIRILELATNSHLVLGIGGQTGKDNLISIFIFDALHRADEVFTTIIQVGQSQSGSRGTGIRLLEDVHRRGDCRLLVCMEATLSLGDGNRRLGFAPGFAGYLVIISIFFQSGNIGIIDATIADRSSATGNMDDRAAAQQVLHVDGFANEHTKGDTFHITLQVGCQELFVGIGCQHIAACILYRYLNLAIVVTGRNASAVFFTTYGSPGKAFA